MRQSLWFVANFYNFLSYVGLVTLQWAPLILEGN